MRLNGFLPYQRYMIGSIPSVIAILFLSLPSFGQTWQRLATDNLSVAYIDTSTIVVVGQYGRIVRSEDGGHRWVQQNSGTHQALWGVHFFDKWRGIVVGDSGMVLRTMDGGETWVRQSVGVDASWRRMTFPSASVGYVVGLNGRIMKTTNAGETWRELVSGTTNHLFGIAFYDELSGVAVGASGTILHTIDGGELWSIKTSGTDATLTAADFAGFAKGLIVGSSGIVLGSEDGGSTWAVLTENMSQYLQLHTVHLFDSERAIAAGTSTQVSKMAVTTDGGSTWSKNIAGAPLSGIFFLEEMAFLDAKRGVVVGGASYIAITMDGGESWTKLTQSYVYDIAFERSLNGIGFVDADTGIVAMSEGRYSRTTDGGVSWNHMRAPVLDNLREVYVRNRDTMLMAGDFAAMLVSTDQGVTWRQYLPEQDDYADYCLSMSFVNSRVGYKSGYHFIFQPGDKLIFRTTDGGLSWRGLVLDSNIVTLSDVMALSEDTAFVVGLWRDQHKRCSILYRTIDGGENWEELLSRPDEADGTIGLIRTFFVDYHRGFVTGSRGLLYRTTDGGRTWDSVESGSRGALIDVRFFNDKIGYVVGSRDATIMSTTDGGETWIREHPWPPLYRDSMVAFNYVSLLPDNQTVLITGERILLRKKLPSAVSDAHHEAKPGYRGATPRLSMRMLPNPVRGEVVIIVEGGNHQWSTPCNVSVYDMLGRHIAEISDVHYGDGRIEARVNTEGLSSGAYMVRCDCGEDAGTGQMHVER